MTGLHKIFEGNIFDMKPLEKGLVFVYSSKDEQGVDRAAYNMISFDTGRMSPVTTSNYLLAKFGTRYKTFKKKTKSVFESKVLNLPGDRIFILDPDGTANIYDAEGWVLWSSTLLYKDTCPTDIAIYNDSLWACFKEYNSLIRFNINTMHEELRIGGGENSPFSRPVQISSCEDGLIICNEGSNTIIKLNPSDYSIKTLYDFTESVKGYLRVGDKEFAALKSGLYFVF